MATFEVISAAAIGGGGGGSLGYSVADVTLTNDEFKAMPSTPFEIVAPVGAGKTILPVAATTILNTTAGAYDAPGNNGVKIRGSIAPFFPDYMVATNMGIDDSEGIYYTVMFLNNNGSNYFTPEYIENTGVVVTNPGGVDFTGGNAANTFRVIFYYIVVDL